MAITSTRQKLASSRPANTSEAELYLVPAATEIDAVLRICNQDSVQRTYEVAHTTAGHGDVAADGDDWLAYDKVIPGNDTHEISIHANATETIRIQASVADLLSFHLSGNKKVTS
ncbi:MAG: hypothetical protein GY820_17005 [Gammaproteobacteria bacterium]|nr:hypothetical protein [Gammaproteobacteria bacterium]